MAKYSYYFWGNSSYFYYFKNVGTASAPSFANPVYNPFSIGQLGFTGNAAPAFTDLDNDGDFDMMIGAPNAYFYYFKNVGTANAPSFANPVYNPFSIGQLGFTGNAAPTFGDLDNDGDFDMMVGCPNAYFYYFKNVGTSSAPSFANPVYNPFSIGQLGFTGNANPALVDLDNDGDLDMMAGCPNAYFYYFKNSATYTNVPYLASNASILKIFPNPTVSSVLIVTDSHLSNATLVVYNSRGQLVKRIDNLNGIENEFLCNDLSSGLYFLKIIQNEHPTSFYKLVVLDN